MVKIIRYLSCKSLDPLSKKQNTLPENSQTTKILIIFQLSYLVHRRLPQWNLKVDKLKPHLFEVWGETAGQVLVSLWFDVVIGDRRTGSICYLFCKQTFRTPRCLLGNNFSTYARAAFRPQWYRPSLQVLPFTGLTRNRNLERQGSLYPGTMLLSTGQEWND